jgi:hypothetical protein
MRFLITGTDICGQIVLRRETAADALTKAAELAQNGYHEISITAPDGHKYPSQTFDQLPTDGLSCENPISTKGRPPEGAPRSSKGSDA